MADGIANWHLFDAESGVVPDEFPDKGDLVRPWTFLLEEIPANVPSALTLMVGPEGGWSPAERETLLLAGAVPVDLNSHVLRTETAAVVGVFALQAIRRAWLDPASCSDS